MKRKMETLLSASRQMKALTAPTLLAMSLSMSAYAVDLPTGEDITHGDADIFRDTDSLTVDQHSSNLVINWDDFSIASGNTVNFLQNRSDVVLNRVVGDNPSNIFGSINAGGHVFLINQSGILFAPGARVDAAGLVASTLDMADEDFLAGNYLFEGAGGDVINQGELVAADDGYVALFGRQAINEGIISARLGSVALASGDRIAMDFTGDGLIRLEVDSAVVDGLVSNHNLIYAEGGRVYMTASAAGDLAATVVNNEGIIEATGVEERDGQVFLTAAGGSLNHSGSIDVSGADNGDGGDVLLDSDATTLISGSIEAASGALAGQGGSVQVLGDQVGIDNGAVIDASGANGGGQILVGGDYQGGNADVRNASRTFVGDATLTADAINNGDGGRIIVWADEVTRFYGGLSATGGANGGDGGFAEVSGKQNLGFYGSVDLTAAYGTLGTLLLDPQVLQIVNTGGSLDGNVPTINFADGGVTDTVGVDVINAAGASIVLEAGQIDFLNSADISLALDNSITFTADSVTAGGGTGGISNPGGFSFDITTTGIGTISFDASGLINLAGTSLNSDSTVSLTSGGSVTLGNVDAGSLDITAAGNIGHSSGLNSVIVSGQTNLNADTNAITVSLDSANNDFNNVVLGGTGSFTTVTVRDTTGLVIGGSAGTLNARADGGVLDLSGGSYATLNAQSNGNITQSGALAVSGNANLRAAAAGHTIVLTDAGNEFSTVSTSGGGADFDAVSITDADTADNGLTYTGQTAALTIDAGGSFHFTGGPGSGNYTTADVTAGGDITKGGSLNIGTLNLTSDAAPIDVTLDGNGNQFGTVTMTSVGAGSFDTVSFQRTGASLFNIGGDATTLNVVAGGGPLNLTGGDYTTLDLNSAGSITQTGPVGVSGTMKLSPGTSGAISVTLDDADNEFNIVDLNAGNNALTLVNLVEADVVGDGLTIGGANLNTVSLIVDAGGDLIFTDGAGVGSGAGSVSYVTIDAIAGGEITQTGILRAGGAASFDAGANAITLDLANRFGGVVDLSGSVVEINNDQALTLGVVTATDILNVNAIGPITQNGTDIITVANAASFDSGPSLITLDQANLFGGLVDLSGSIIQINNDQALTLGVVTATNTLDVTADGAISQNGGDVITVTNTADFDATGNAITLDQANLFSGAVSLSGSAVEIINDQALTLGVVTATDTLDVTAKGAISQTGALSVSSTTTLTADTNAITVTLTDAANDFASVVLATINGGSFSNAEVVDASALTIGGSADTLSATAGGALIFSGGGYTTLNGTATGNISRSGNLAVTGTATMTADTNSITLGFGGVGSEFAILDLASVNGGSFSSATVFDPNLVTISGDAGVLNAIAGTTLTLGGGTYGALNAEILSGSSLNQTGPVIVTGATNIVANVNSITVDLSDAGNDFNTINFTGVTGATFNDVVIVDTTALSVGNLVVGGPGNIDISADDGLTVTGTVSTATGDITLNADADAAGAGLLTLAATSLVSSAADLTLTAADFELDMPAGDLSAIGTFDLVFTQAGDLCLGLSSAGVGCQINLDNTDISALTAVGGELVLDNSGNAIRAEAADFSGTDLVLLGSTINDENAGTGLDNIGALTLTTTDSIGNLNGGLNIDAASVEVTGSNGSSVTLFGDSVGNTTYTIGSAGSIGNLSITETTGDLIIAGSDTDGNTTLFAIAGKLDIDGAVDSGGDVGLAGFAGIDLGADITTTADNVILNSAAILTADVAIHTGVGIGSIVFAGTIDSDAGNNWALDLTADTGSIDLQSDVGATDALASLTVNSATAATFRGDVTTVGAQDVTATTINTNGTHTTTDSNIDLTGDVVLQAATALTTGADVGDITVTGTINGAQILGLTAGAGSINLQSAVGGSAPLTQLIVNSADTTTFGGNVTTTSGQSITSTTIQTNGTHAVTGFGNIDLTGNVDLLGATTLDSAGSVTVTGSIDGAEDLIVDASTSVDLQGDVGVSTALISIDVTAGATITLGGDVTTVGAQSFNGILTRTSGVHTTTDSNIRFDGGLTLLADTTLNTGAGGGNVTVTGVTNGAFALDVTAGTGAVLFDNVLSGLASLTINSAAMATFDSVAVTSGVQDITADLINVGSIHATTDSDLLLTGDVVLAGATNLSTGAGDGDIIVTGTVNGAGDLNIAAGTGDVELQSDVGDTTPLSSLIIANGTTATLGGNVTTTNNQVYNADTTETNGIHTTTGANIQVVNALVALNDTTFDTGAALGGTVFFQGTADGPGAVTVTAGTGDFDVTGSIGATTPLASLTVNSANVATFGGDVTTVGVQDVTATTINTNGTHITTDSDIDLNGAVELQAATALTTGADAGNITVTGTINGAQTLDLTAGTGSIDLQSAVGNATPLTSLTVNSANNVDLQAVTAGAIIQSAGTGTTTIDGVLTSNVGDINFTTNQIVQNAGIVSAGEVLLDAAADVSLDAGSITANRLIHIIAGAGVLQDAVNHGGLQATDLLLQGTGDFTLVTDAATNLVDNVATVGTVAGVVTFENDQALVIGTVNDAAANPNNGAAAQTLLISTSAGDLTVDQAVTATTGNLLLESQLGNLVVNQAVNGASHVTLLAGRGVNQGADGDVSAGADLYVASGNSDGIIMADGAVSTAVGTAVYETLNVGADIYVGSIAGNTIRIRGSSLIDNGDLHTDIIGNAVRLSMSAIGQPDGTGNGAIDTDIGVATLTASSSGSVYVTDVDDLTIGSITIPVYSRVNLDNTVTLGGGVTTAGSSAFSSMIVQALNALTVDQAVTATNGHILLASSAGDVVINNTVTASAGNVQVSAQNDVTQAAAGDISAAGTIFVNAATGDIAMTNGADSIATGNVVYTAGGDVTVASLNGANLAVNAGGSIIDGGDANVDLISVDGLQLVAGGSIGQPQGTGNGPLETSVTAVAMTAGAAGSIYLVETNGLLIQNVPAVSYNLVNADGTVSLQAGAALTDATAGQNIKINAGGGITVNIPVAATAADILLQSVTNDVGLNNTLNAGGNISLLAALSVFQNAAGDITAGGTLDVDAGSADIIMNDDALSNVTGNVRYDAGGNVVLGGISGANVMVVAGGSITDGGDTHVDVVAGTAQLSAAGNIGEAAGTNNGPIETTVGTLAASAGTGNIYLSETDDLTIGSVAAIDVLRVNIDSTTTNQAGALLEGATAAQNLKIEAGNGIIVANAVEATAADLLLDAQGGDLAINATVDAAGNASLLSSANVTQSADGDVTVGGTLDVNAQGGDISMTDGAISAATGNIRYLATGDIRLASLNGANVLVNAGGSIIDNGEADVDVIATTAQLIAGTSIGEAAGTNNGPIETTVGTLAASAGTGNIYLSETDDLTIGSVAAIDVLRVNIDSTTTNQAGALLEGAIAAQNLKIEAGNGIVVASAVEATAADLLLNAQGGDLAINATVDAGGNASLLSSANVTQSADGDVTVGGTLDVNAQGGDISMTDGAISAATGNLRYLATGDIRLASLNGANVLVNAGGSIIDNGEADVDVIATTAQLIAGTSIGEAAGTNNGPIETTVGTLAASAGTGNIYLSETDDLTIGSVAAIDVLRVNIDSTTTNQAGALLEGAIAAQNLKIEAGNGIIVANAVEATAADLLLDAQGGDLAINAAVTAGGNASLLASANVTQSADGDVTVGGTLDVNAQGGDITMTDGAISAATGNIRYLATGDIRLASLNGANVLVQTTGGSIIDNGETDVDLIGASVQLRALNSIGEPDGTNNGLLETTAGTFNALASNGGIYIDETDALVIDEAVAVIDVLRVNIDSTTSNQAGTSVLFGAFAGTDVIVRADTDLTVANNGAPVAGVFASAGNVLLRAETGNLQINDAVRASAGDVTLQAPAGTIGQGVEGDVTAGGDVFAQANGTITMADGAVSQATNNVFYGSAADLRIGSLTGADVLIDVGGSIIDNGDAHVDVVATNAQLRAGTSIGEADGTNNGPLETTVTTLAASAGTGNIYLTETDALVIGPVAAIDVDSVGLNATSSVNAGSALAGAVAAQNLKIEAVAGGITVDSAVEATAADLLLDAQGGDLAINATVDAAGNASLLSSANVTQSADGDVTVGGTLDVNAQGGDISMTDGAISAATGNIRYLATGDIRLASLNGANVLVNAGGSIIDNGDADRDVIALTAQLIAAVDVGASGDSLDTDIGVLAASATTGGVRINDLTDLEIGSVAAIDVERVNIDSTTTTQSGALLEGIQAAQNIRVAAENIDVFREVRSTGGDIRLQARNGQIEQTDDLGAVIAEAGNIEMFADNGNILLRLVSAEGNQVTLTASEQILNNNGALTNVIADVLLASARDAIGVTAGYFTDPDSDQRLTTEVDSRIEVSLSESGTVAIDNTSTGGDVDVLFTLPLADVDNGSSVWVRNSEGLNTSGLLFATESNGVEFNGNLQLLAVNGDLSLNEALVGDANDVNLVAQWMRLEAARGAFLNGDGSRFQQVGDGLGLTADDLVLITGGDLGVSATVDRLNVIGTGLYQVAVGGTPGAGGENANLDMQLSRRDIALVDEAIRFETIVIDRQTDPAPSWIADLDNFFIGLGATGWQENVFGLFTTGTARVISLRQDDGVDMTHDGSIRFVDNVEAGQLSLPADLTIEVRAGEFGTEYAGTIYVDTGVTFVAQNVGTPVTGSAAIFGNVLIDGSVVVQEDRSVELQGRGGDIIIDSDESAAGRVLLSPGLGFDVIFTNAATFTVTQGVGAEGDLVILSARNVVMDPGTAIIADGSVLIGADNITGDVVLAEGSTAVQGDVILYNVTANANGNGIGDVVVYTTGEAAGDTYSFDFGTGVQTYEISGRIVLGRQDVFDNLITELANDPLFLDNPANIPPPAVQGFNVRLIAADSIESGWAVDYDAGLLPEQEPVHVVATETMELRAINGLVGGTVAPQGLEGLTAAEQPLRVVVGDLMRLGAGDYDRYATSVHLVGTAERFEEIRLTPGLITFNNWQIGGNLEPKFVSGTPADMAAYYMAGYGELERRPAQAGVALSHGTDNALQLISFAPGQPEPLTALWVVDDTPFGNEVLEKPEEEPFRSFEVRTGDTLWDLAEEFLGDAERWQEIWWLTPDIDNPDLIEPGQKINLEREQLELLQQIQQEEEARAAP